MTGSKAKCDSCSQPLFCRQQFIPCCGPCGRRFHRKCLGIFDEEYELYMSTGSSTYKCSQCTRRNGFDNIGLPMPAVSTPLDQDVTTCDGACGQLRVVVQALCDKIASLTSVVLDLKNDNDSLRLHLARNTELLRKCTPQQKCDGNEWRPLAPSPTSLWSHAASLRVLSIDFASRQREATSLANQMPRCVIGLPCGLTVTSQK
nr:uncharacterized protein LOC129383761 [Dermacentor andersoni]